MFMATPVLMPRQGQSVETCLILQWKKHKGDVVRKGQAICEVETDKATFEVESPADGVLLETFFDEGRDVPVLATIAAIGQPGESVESLRPGRDTGVQKEVVETERSEKPVEAAKTGVGAERRTAQPSAQIGDGRTNISPRAKKLAERGGIDTTGLVGTGPEGRIIERDVLKEISSKEPLTPAAKELVASTGVLPPAAGSGMGGRITARDVAAAVADAPQTQKTPDAVREIPLKGIRKLIADRMLASLQTTAQLTLNSSADARAILDFRKKLKASPEELGLSGITINDLILLAVARTLPDFKELNCHFLGDKILQFESVHLAFAVDTPRGLMVPVIRHTNTLSLKAISDEAKRLREGCIKGGISPDDLKGGTFTVTNLGNFGIEAFTPILNPPQVGILGVGNVNPKPVQVEDEVAFVPHIGFSLTINHQVVDGALAAKFLQGLSKAVSTIDLLLAI
jgi:pyruvate dehydrogenase E2 component (dihydrolipoamide acetyltransferase)